VSDRPIAPPDIVLTGRFEPNEERRYTHVPFRVPDGLDQIHVRLGYGDRITSDPRARDGNTLDIGLFDERGTVASGPGFRGWSGSNRLAFTVGADWATPPYRSGPIGAGTWHVLLGPYKVWANGLDYQVEIWFDPGLVGQPPVPDLAGVGPSPLPPPAEPGWLRADLHCHSLYSDGDSWPWDLLAAASAAGLDVLAITDHNGAHGGLPAWAAGISAPLLVPGVEVTTYGGHWNAWGGAGWYDFREPTDEATQRAMDQARADGAFVSVNHPKPLGPDWGFPGVTGFDGLEVWNGPWAGMNRVALDRWDALLRAGEHVIAVGGSDTHQLTHRSEKAFPPKLGEPTTWLGLDPGEPPTVAAVLAALRAGRCFVAVSPSGPELYVAPDPGGTAGVRVRIVGAPGADLQLLGQTGEPETISIDGPDVTVTRHIPPDSAYLRAEVVTDHGDALAISNPVWRDPATFGP